MDTDTFGGNVGRGFAHGVGMMLAYGVALVLLTWLTTAQAAEEAPEDQQAALQGASCRAGTWVN